MPRPAVLGCVSENHPPPAGGAGGARAVHVTHVGFGDRHSTQLPRLGTAGPATGGFISQPQVFVSVRGTEIVCPCRGEATAHHVRGVKHETLISSEATSFKSDSLHRQSLSVQRPLERCLVPPVKAHQADATHSHLHLPPPLSESRPPRKSENGRSSVPGSLAVKHGCVTLPQPVDIKGEGLLGLLKNASLTAERMSCIKRTSPPLLS